MRQAKCVPGFEFLYFSDLYEWLQRDQWVFFDDKPMHPAVIRNMTLTGLIRAIDSGILRECLDAATKQPYTSLTVIQRENIRNG